MVVPDDRDERRQYERPEPYFGTAVTALLKGIAETPELEVHIVSCTQVPLRAPGQLAKNIFYHSVLIGKWGWMRGAFVGCALAVRRKLNEIRPDLVHGQGTERYAALSAAWSGFPNVMTIHGNMREIERILHPRAFSYLWLAARLERLTIPKSGGVICITTYTRDAVAALAKRTWVLPNAVDPSFFEIDVKPDGNAPPLVLCVGDIGVRKNQNNFIRALDGVAAGLKFRVAFMGRIYETQPYAREFLDLVKARAWCAYEGFVDREKLKACIRQASVLALPSVEDNCPMVVLESMAAGLPVLASKVGGVPDLIEHNVTGLLCDPSRPETFGAGLVKLLESVEFRATVAQNGKRHALNAFHPRVIARGHVGIYQQKLKDGET